jgi:hypothetical protein
MIAAQLVENKGQKTTVLEVKSSRIIDALLQQGGDA